MFSLADMITKDLATSQQHCYTTLWNIRNVYFFLSIFH